MAGAEDHDASEVRVQLSQDQRAAGQARGAAREALVRWRLPHLVDAVVLAVSELVTNAVRHGWPPVSVELQRQEQQVHLHVHDGNPVEPPVPADEVDADAESGRGFGIVAAVADDVAVEQVADDGKVVHVVFDAGRDADR